MAAPVAVLDTVRIHLLPEDDIPVDHREYILFTLQMGINDRGPAPDIVAANGDIWKGWVEVDPLCGDYYCLVGNPAPIFPDRVYSKCKGLTGVQPVNPRKVKRQVNIPDWGSNSILELIKSKRNDAFVRIPFVITKEDTVSAEDSHFELDRLFHSVDRIEPCDFSFLNPKYVPPPGEPFWSRNYIFNHVAGGNIQFPVEFTGAMCSVALCSQNEDGLGEAEKRRMFDEFPELLHQQD